MDLMHLLVILIYLLQDHINLFLWDFINSLDYIIALQKVKYIQIMDIQIGYSL